MSFELRQQWLLDAAARVERGRFARPDMERRFRLMSLPEDRTAAWWVVLVIGLVFSAYAATDWVLFADRRELGGLLALRAGFLACSLAFLGPLRACASSESLDRLLGLWCAALIVVFLATAATRPPGSVGVIVTYLPMLLFFYAAVPLPHATRIAFAWTVCVGFLSIRWFVAHDGDPTGWNAVLIGSVATHALGTLISLRANATARRLVALGWRTEGLRAAADSAAGLREFRLAVDATPAERATAFGAVHPDDAAALEVSVAAVRDARADFRSDFRVRTPLGWRWIRAAGVVVDEGPDAGATIAGFSWDIHERRVAEQRADWWRDRLEATLQRARMVVWERRIDDNTRRAFGPQGDVLGCEPESPAEADALLHPDDRERDTMLFDAALRDGTDYANEFRVVRADGSTCWIHSQGRPLRDAGGRVVGMSGVAIDISERKALERDIEGLRRRLSDTLDAARMYSWQWDLRTGVRSTLGPGATVLGNEPATVAEAYAVVHPEDRAAARATVEDAIATGRTYEHELRVATDSGWKWIYSRGTPVPGPDGRVERLVGVAVDIDARKRAERRVEELDDRLQLAVCAARLNPWSVDLRTLAIDPGPLDEDLYGRRIPTHDAMREIVPAEDWPGIEGLAATAAASPDGAHAIEFRVNHARLGLRWIACHARVLRDAGGEPSRLVGVSFDVTARRSAEHALARSEDRLQQALHAGGMTLWTWAPGAGFRAAYGGAVQLFGRDSASRTEFLDLVHPDDRDRVATRFLDALGSGAQFVDEYRVVRPGQPVAWVHSSARVDVDEQHGIRTMAGVTVDVTARKLAELELQQTQLRLTRALDAAGMICWEWDLRTGQRRSVGDDAHLLGRVPATREEFRAIVHPDDLALCDRSVAHAIAQRGGYRSEFRVVHPDGSARWLLSMGEVACDAQGEPAVLAGVAMDVTERRHVESMLEQSRRWRDLAVQAGDMNLWEVDPATGERRGGEADPRIFGCSPRSLADFLALVHADDAARVKDAWTRCFMHGDPIALEFRIRRADDGTPRWLSSRGKRQRDEVTGRVRIVGVTTDVTSRKTAEIELRDALRAAHQASEAKSAFLATVSHELRTPLSAVVGFTELLGQTSLDAVQSSHVQLLQGSARQLLALISHVLDFSRIEAGEMPIDAQPLAPEACVEACLDLFEAQAEAKGLALTMVSRGPATRAVVGDATRIRQIVANLLSNAVKFTAAGGVRCELDVADDGGRALVAIRVHDTGIGFGVDAQERLFQPFQQGDASTTRRFGGSGLGLSICKRLALLMDGDIRVVASSTSGSVVEVALRMPWSSADAGPAGNPAFDASALVAGVPHLLAADVAAQLRELGCRATVDPRARGAALAAAGGAYDVVVACRDAGGRIAPWPAARSGGPLPLLELRRLDELNAADDGPAPGRHVALSRTLRPSRLRTALSALVHAPAPARRDDARQPPAPAPDVAAPAPIRALIAEDNPVNQLLLQLQLGTFGIEADVAESGDAAVAAAARGGYDLVLMDIEMPDVDGMEATRRIRALGLAREPVIVAVTAHVLADSRERFLGAGMDDYLRKPVSIDDLRGVLQRTLRATAV